MHRKQAALAVHAARYTAGELSEPEIVRSELAARASSVGGRRAQRQCVCHTSPTEVYAAVGSSGMWERQTSGRRLCSRTAGHPARSAFAPGPKARLGAARWARATRGLGAAASDGYTSR